MQTENKRVIMRIELSATAAKSFNESTDKRGMTQVAAASRIVQWFTNQDSETQAAILGLMPKEFPFDETRRLLEVMARSK